MADDLPALQRRIETRLNAPVFAVSPVMPATPGGVPLLEPGGNCWRVVPATRVAFLIDAEAYFRAFAEAVERARSSVLIAGWDFNGSTEMWHGERSSDLPPQLASFLAQALPNEE